MFKKWVVAALLLLLLSGIQLIAKNDKDMDEFFTEPEPAAKQQVTPAKQDSLVNDIIQENYKKKDARLAMLMSAVIPGAGQFYADKSALTAYIFPVIELAVIGGMIYYTNQGDDKVKAYKKYATGETVTFSINNVTYTGPRYWRDFQLAVEDTLIRVRTYDIYEPDFFRLDTNNSQHFYEDIGKYNKYVFGWADWYTTYAEGVASNLTLGNLNPQPIFVFSGTTNDPTNLWIGNRPLSDPTGDYQAPYSAMRQTYIKMRQQAEDKYLMADYLSFLIAFNHIGAAIDAVRVTNKRNSLSLSQAPVQFKYYATVRNSHVTPMVGLNWSF